MNITGITYRNTRHGEDAFINEYRAQLAVLGRRPAGIEKKEGMNEEDSFDIGGGMSFDLDCRMRRSQGCLGRHI
jgi:hypothetical protein